MKTAILIADSGGTKTDWCLLDSTGVKTFFQTDSYHPHLMNDNWVKSKKEFWKDYLSVYSLKVIFYGSGCSSPESQKHVQQVFQHWGFKHIDVRSDLIGAAIAGLKSSNGYIGILGTGSVIAQIKDQKIEQLIGGYGYLIGDEGGGYYFGKMLIHAYLGGNMSSELMSVLTEGLGGRDNVLRQVYSPMGKNYLGGLSEFFAKEEFEELLYLHQQNIDLFLTSYLPKAPIEKKISFVGSYAKANEAYLRKALEMSGWEVGLVVAKPIEELAEYFSETAF